MCILPNKKEGEELGEGGEEHMKGVRLIADEMS